MNPGVFVLLLSMALLMAGTLITYERLLAATRAERDAYEDDLRRLSQQRHPSSIRRGNVRLIAGGE